jgi:hypothetical protein
MFYLIIFSLEVIVTGGINFSQTPSGIDNVVAQNTSSLAFPQLAESTNVFTAAWAVIVGVASYIALFFQIIFLWCPTVFSSYGMWFWWYICLPVDIGMVLSIIFIVRGVHSS